MASEKKDLKIAKDFFKEDVKQYPITNIQSIVEFLNYLQDEKITTETELSRSWHLIAENFPEGCAREFAMKLETDEMGFRGNRFFPVSFRFKDGDASKIQMKINECLSVVQKLWDKATQEGKLVGYKKKYLGTLLGALESFLYRIEPFRNELTSVSSDETHFMKNIMSIYTNASKLRSLDDEINGVEKKDPMKVLEEVIYTLPKQQQYGIVQDFLWTHFKPAWVLNMSNEQIKEILSLILMESSELNITVKHTQLEELFLRLESSDRTNFIHNIKKYLTGREKNILLKGEDSVG